MTWAQACREAHRSGSIELCTGGAAWVTLGRDLSLLILWDEGCRVDRLGRVGAYNWAWEPGE